MLEWLVRQSAILSMKVVLLFYRKHQLVRPTRKQVVPCLLSTFFIRFTLACVFGEKFPKIPKTCRKILKMKNLLDCMLLYNLCRVSGGGGQRARVALVPLERKEHGQVIIVIVSLLRQPRQLLKHQRRLRGRLLRAPAQGVPVVPLLPGDRADVRLPRVVRPERERER